MARKKADKVKPAAPMPESSGFPLNSPGSDADSHQAVSRHKKIEMRAYGYWVQRGRQGGSPEEDWFRAEQEINLEPSN